MTAFVSRTKRTQK